MKMPSKNYKKRKTRRERYIADANPNSSLQSSDLDVQQEHSDQYSNPQNPNSSLQSSDQDVQPEHSDQYSNPHIFNSPTQGGDLTQIPSQVSQVGQNQLRFTFDHISINDQSEENPIPDLPGTPQAPLTPLTPYSLTSEAIVPRKQRKTRESSVDTLSLVSYTVSDFSSRASSPSCSYSSKNKGGRPKKIIRKNAGRKPKPINTTSSAQIRNINFSNLPFLNLATEMSDDPACICHRTDMRLYEDNNPYGPLHLSQLWNNLSEWLNEVDIFSFL